MAEPEILGCVISILELAFVLSFLQNLMPLTYSSEIFLEEIKNKFLERLKIHHKKGGV